MRSTEITKAFATGFLVLYSFWAVINIGIIGFLITASIGLIVFGWLDSLEVATALVVFSGFVYYTLKKKAYRAQIHENFEGNDLGVILPGGPMYKNENKDAHESSGEYLGPGAANSDSLVEISNRVASFTKKSEPAIQGHYSSSFVEGFADADVTDAPVPDAGSEGQKKKTEGFSKKAPVKIEESNTVSDQLKKDLPAPDSVKELGTPSTKKGADDTMLFRLGQIPTDAKDGPHIDAATTMMNALNALKPEQIEAMTNDTRKLLDTQKNLMGMLETMKPMLQDGKQLIDTFGTMFAK